MGLFGTKKPKTAKLYLIARISKDAHDWNEEVCSHFKAPIEIFIPHHHNPYNLEHPKIPQPVVNTDINAMQEAHIGFALPEFGNDCSFETGWFAGKNKPLVYFVNDQLHWLRDWMIKSNLTRIVTNNSQSYKTLKSDEILRDKKVVFINNLDEINQQIHEVYREHYV
ncbi:hypothetical protein A3A71_01885 [Candidatus Berkelbacteria bacterium RIFCSPLOWO2_01_FULL_50_28]|uniref:Nucleoside 2-deoxyribosyltransferase n=1 Tax=Candidatus Berkelbacteria bacterium RIFCSPLOWO2_01_FULL_50_28 TaxID=1797471 RepID=A0A1F5EBJ2_9BACT|nr:MAG: hypothetical protein A3F39_00150 [Candidatus Berkelbacteria bacterium RIFCSPHIGHO2_12_FULL_50_11]OGD64777.1 MAG: hypothetical protein A3A71_01885 [Candidatus Berkelbacteria bacterium RIFCSPLOWO2_01_FULL_50_28]